MFNEDVNANYQKALSDFKRDYEFQKECDILETKYEWAASNIFNLETYDSSLDELFVKKIMEVCKVILERKTFEYMEANDTNYITYIGVCQRLNSLGWLDWGTSIRGAWFDYSYYNTEANPMLMGCSSKDDIEVYLSEGSIRALIDFMEAE